MAPHLLRRPFLVLGSAFFAILLGSTAWPAAGDLEPRQTWSPRGSLFLVSTERGAAVDFEVGGQVRLPLAPKSAVTSLASVADGFWAAGTILHEEGRRELRVWKGDRRRAVEMPAPPGQRAFLRDQPVLLSMGGKLVGMAWLEGETPFNLGVMAAAWDGRRWGRPEQVSPVGRDSQLAPSGVVLADGTWLLAWSAVDGEDDEIAWAKRENGVWSPPRYASLDNQVPDVRPALVATPRGALLAWSRYDGETYRVLLSRFDGSGFRDERFVVGEGSTSPSFVAGPNGPRLVFRTGPTRGWALVELDFLGRTQTVGRIETESREARPLVVEAPSGELALRFLGETQARLLSRSAE